MTERRVDPFTGRSVLVAPSRRGLGGLRAGGLPRLTTRCPFCPGHEPDTEVTVARWPTEGPWQARVVLNKFPLVGGEDELGVHEVVIDAREHDVDLASMSPGHLEGLLSLIRARVRALSERGDVAAVVPFRNRGIRAGSSQPHPHSQIIATRWVPADVALRWTRLDGTDLYARELERELGEGRLVEVDDHLAVFCPRASTRNYELRLAPLAPVGGFEAATDAELASLAAGLKRACARLRDPVGLEDFNLVFRLPPTRATGPGACWYVDLLPRTGDGAGYELASNERVLVVSPEEAAAAYRGSAPAS